MVKKLSLAILAVFLVLLGGGVSARETSIAVYVFASPGTSSSDTSGFIDPNTEKADRELRQREDSVRDIKKALEGKRGIRLVESPEEASVKLEITWRSAFTAKINILNPQPALPIEIRTNLMVGEYLLPITSAGHRPGWRGAAESIAQQVERWVKSNLERLSQSS